MNWWNWRDYLSQVLNDHIWKAFLHYPQEKKENINIA